MLPIQALIALIICFIDKTNAQTGGTTATGDYYVCVPADSCISTGGGGPGTGIDPRIVTTGQLCPSGLIACYTQGPSSQCSNRAAVSTADGGAPAGAHPWLAFIQNSTNPTYAGAGVLIDNYHVLTAAHKVAGDIGNAANVKVTMAAFTNNPQTQPADKIRVHPSYNSAARNYKNDIAIVRVKTPFKLSLNSVNTACLPAGTSASSYVGQTCLVAGWGETAFKKNDIPYNPLKQVNVNVASYEACRASYANILGANNVDQYLDVNYAEVCAGGGAQKDACTFDGGAPLMCPSAPKGTITGLVIWGKGCGQAGVYGVYVAVPFYRSWIDTTLAELNA